MPSPIREISEILKNNRSFLVASHVNPDGDAIGATAALGFLLRALGKDVVLYNPSGLPERYAWLALPGPLSTRLPEVLPDWTVTLDCGAPERLGPELSARLDPERTVNIDHHLGNPDFGAVNWVDPAEPAVGAMVAKLARELGAPLTGGLAEAVYLAVVTDTGHFTYGNTTPEVLELTAELLRGGLDLEGVNARVNNQWSPRRLELWAAWSCATTAAWPWPWSPETTWTEPGPRPRTARSSSIFSAACAAPGSVCWCARKGRSAGS